MMTMELTCDGCGQVANVEHVERRLRRLEWATRYRPVHILTLILGGVSPRLDSDYLYAAEAVLQGDAGNILRAAAISTEGKTHEAVLAEFQKLGLMLTYMLECPANEDIAPEQLRELLDKQFPATVARIRRSLRPKRVVMISRELVGVADILRVTELGCPVSPKSGPPFQVSASWDEESVRALREALVGP